MLKALFEKKANNLMGERQVTIAFLGDSVTQGCFEAYEKSPGVIETTFDVSQVYHTKLKEMISQIYPRVPVNIINAGVSGDSAAGGLARLERDVLSYRPDLTVVCFGLNDAGRGLDYVVEYGNNLGQIFRTLQQHGSEVLFMTPNMMCNGVSPFIQNDLVRQVAGGCAAIQNSGTMDAFMDCARKICAENGVAVCDCYAKWKALAAGGVEISDLLANHINHPNGFMHQLFANALFDMLFLRGC